MWIKLLKLCFGIIYIREVDFITQLILIRIIIHNHNKMKLVNKVLYWTNKAFRKLDLFPTTNFIRYNAEDYYSTTTGGIASLAIIIIFTVLFASKGLRTLQRKIIESSVQTLNDIDPPTLRIKTSPSDNFMFAITLFGFDLSNTTYKLFNITLWQSYYGPGYSFLNETLIPLSPCTPEHLDFGDNVKSVFQKFNMAKSLCPPLNFEFQVGGKPISDISSVLTILVSRCNGSVDPGCVSSSELNNIEAKVNKFTLIVPVINVQLNPGSENYKSYYLEDRNYFQFDSSMGMRSVGNLQETVVNTDVSIMPFEDIQSQNFTVLPQIFTNTPYLLNSSSHYAKITFNKGSKTTIYNRSFNKIDAYFSYVGGLIGTIIGLIFILNIYTQKAFEISISHKLFKDPKGEDINSGSFNIFYLLTMVIKKIINFCKCDVDWPKTQVFIDCVEQINLQLDITYIMKRLMFVETAVELLFDKHNFEALHLKQKHSIDQVKTRRKKHFCNEVIAANLNFDNFEQNHKVQNRQISEESIVGKDITFQQSPDIRQQALQKIGDVSDLSMSSSGRENGLKTNIIKVMNEYKKGDKFSQKVIEKLNKRICEQIFMKKFQQPQIEKDGTQLIMITTEENEINEVKFQNKVNQEVMEDQNQD